MTGSGTVTDPYIIANVTDLQNMENDLDAYYELGGNIDATATSGWNGGAGFLPIGQAGYFTGQLEGHDYTISGLFINRAANYQALFYNIDTGAVIQNVKMTGVNITTSGAGIGVSGALVGYMNAGTVTNCSSTGSVTGTGTTDIFGGLIGEIVAGAISKCWSSCTVAAGDDYAGGFIGYAIGGTIDDCYARGSATAGDDYAGGFIGYNQGATLDDCYSTGIPTATGGFGAGGFCGDNAVGGTITNCFWDTETSGTAVSDGGTGKTTAQMTTQTTFTGAGWDFTDIWYMSSVTNNGYPFLQPTGSELTGRYSVVGTAWRYIDKYGTERYIVGTPVT